LSCLPPSPSCAPSSRACPVDLADVAIMSPSQEDNVRCFGDYVYDLNPSLEDMEVNLVLGEETDAA
jgi:hypothetical protein